MVIVKIRSKMFKFISGFVGTRKRLQQKEKRGEIENFGELKRSKTEGAFFECFLDNSFNSLWRMKRLECDSYGPIYILYV